MDGDPEVVQLAHRNRRRSMVLSTLIQAGLLIAAIVLPLFASHSMKLYIQTPTIPVPRGNPLAETRPAGGNPKPVSGPRTLKFDELLQPPRIPEGVKRLDENYGPVPVTTGPEGGCIGCLPDGVPGAPALMTELTKTTKDPRPPEPDPTPRKPVIVSPPVQEAKLIHRVKPVYPPLAVQTRREGKVELQAIIGTDGTIRDLKVVSGDILFIQASLDAVRQWRYQPTMLGDCPVEVQTRITVIFILNR